MFVVGYEVDLRLIRGRERAALSVSIGSVALPLGLGAALGVWLAHRNHLHHVSTFALFIGTAMAATAFPVLARILTDRGLHRTRIGGLALASAAVADVLAWSLLAVVVALAGSSQPWRVLLAIPYAAAMFLVVRPLLRRLARVYRQAGRLTPNILATVLAGLLLSSYATNWMGLHFIFGAFLFGVVMPREAVLGLREEILARLEQISVLVLLPIYFVVAGLSINLSMIGHSGLVELSAILVVAIAGKLVGAYGGAQIAGIRGRNAGVLATLMNTRGLTELVILGVGLQLHILNKPLYSLMVIMALVTTAMSGPLLTAIGVPVRGPETIRPRNSSTDWSRRSMTSENNWSGKSWRPGLPGTRARTSHTASSALPRTGTRVFGVAVGANLRPDSPRTPTQPAPAMLSPGGLAPDGCHLNVGSRGGPATEPERTLSRFGGQTGGLGGLSALAGWTQLRSVLPVRPGRPVISAGSMSPCRASAAFLCATTLYA